jgi:hypothetical protein
VTVIPNLALPSLYCQQLNYRKHHIIFDIAADDHLRLACWDAAQRPLTIPVFVEDDSGRDSPRPALQIAWLARERLAMGWIRAPRLLSLRQVRLAVRPAAEIGAMDRQTRDWVQGADQRQGSRPRPKLPSDQRPPLHAPQQSPPVAESATIISSLFIPSAGSLAREANI